MNNDMHKLIILHRFRAKGEVGLIVTGMQWLLKYLLSVHLKFEKLGGIAPNRAGRVSPMAAKMTTSSEVQRHKEITQAVHENDVSVLLYSECISNDDMKGENCDANSSFWKVLCCF
jgi:hypothetical protein